MSDADLLSGVRSGDERLAQAFCERVWPTVKGTVRKLLGAADSEADDVTQMAVMEVLGSLRRYRGDVALEAWVRTVTAHTIYKHLRRRGFERKLFTHLEAATTEPVRAAGPSAITRARRAVTRVLEHVARLDEDKATAWVLHDVYGHDMREVAQITEVSETAAQSRVSRGRRALHERLGADLTLVGLLGELEGDES